MFTSAEHGTHSPSVNWPLTRLYVHKTGLCLAAGVSSFHQLCVCAERNHVNGDLQFQFCPLDVTNITMAAQEEINPHTTDTLAHTCTHAHTHTNAHTNKSDLF